MQLNMDFNKKYETRFSKKFKQTKIMKQRVLVHLMLLIFSVSALAGNVTGKYDSRKASFFKRSFTHFKLAQKRALMMESEQLAEALFMAPPPPAQITFTKRVNSGNDDAEERISNGDISRGSSDLELGRDGSRDQIVGMRFTNVIVPSGATITNAYIEFTVDETDSGTANFTIYGEDANDPPNFSSSDDDISDRTQTSASVSWNNVPNWTSVGATHQTPDISSIIQEIVDRGGWSSGNAMVIMIDGTGERTAESYNGSSGDAPLLVIEYDDGLGSGDDLSLEAECGTVGSGLTVNSDGSPSNGAYVVWDSGDQYGTPSNQTEYIRFSVNVSTAGNYKIFARTIAPNTGSDSWWVRANGGTWIKYNSISQSNNWEWHQVHDADNGNSLVTFALSAGANTIDFGRREDCKLDKIFVTLNGSAPAGEGIAATNCAGGANYNIDAVDGQTINTCSGNFYDSGGPSANHQDGEDYSVTFCSDDGSNIQFDFTAFNVENHSSCGYDFLRIYDGSNTSAPAIGGKYCGTNSPGTVTASGTCLHFVWHSDGGYTTSGWEAAISCVNAGGSTDYEIDAVDGQTINTCTGNFFDAAGAGSNYANNEDYSVTFCSDNSDQIQFDFSAFNVENHATCGYDYLSIYNGSNSSAPQIGKYCGTNSPGTVTSTFGCLHFVWHSDGGAVDAGWQAAISCVAGGGGGGGGVGSCSGIVNEGFENGKTGWSDGGGVSTTNDAFVGSSAIELTDDGTWLSQSVPVTGGQTYYLTFAAKAVNNPNWAEVYMVWKNSSWNDIRSAIQPIKNSGFQTFEMIDKAPANAAYLTIGGYKEGYVTKSLIIDDFCLATGPDLGGSNYDMACGCEENMLPNPGVEIHDPGMSFNYSIGANPVAHLGSSANNNGLPPWTTGLSSPYMFYVDDTQDAVNNPEGDYFVILPGNGDCWISNLNFGTELDLIDGEQYIFCFYAASFDTPVNGSGLPTGSSNGGQESGVILLEFDYVNSGVRTVEAWQTPSSASWNNLSWKKYSHTFTYSSADPIENFYFTNSRNNTGTAIDAVTLSRLDCSDTQGNDCPTGSIDFERWTGVSGITIGDLITQQDYPNIPSISGKLTSFQGQVNNGDNYGTRVRGYLNPTETGNYQFNVTGDDAVWLYLSSDTNFVNKTKIAETNNWTNWNEHNKYASQTSGIISLSAGEKYYIELLHKEGGGSDHFQVFWKTPSNSSWTIIDGAHLSGYACGNDGYDCIDALLVNGQNSEEVNRYNPVSGNFNNQLVIAGLSGPQDMVLGPDGLLYVSNYNSDRIKIYDPYTGAFISTFVNSNLNAPTGLTFGPDGNLYVANYNSDNVVKFNGSTGAFMGVFASGNGLSNPGIGLEFGPDGHLYVANDYQKVLRFNGSTGAYIDEFIALSNSSQRIGDIVFDKGCNWYVSNYIGDSIEKFTSNGNYIGRFDNGGSLSSPRGMTFGPDNNLYVADKTDNKVYRFNGTTGNFMDIFANSGNGMSGANIPLFLPKLGCNCEYLLNGGTIGGDVNTCVPLDVPAFTSNSAFNGSVQYQWAQSIDGGETWTDIAGAIGETYDPGIISQDTRFVRRAQVVGCNSFYFSNPVDITFGICEICYDGIDNDGDGLIDCEDGDCNALVVTTTADNIDGDVSSVAALSSNPGADGHISLREAITATQSATGRTSYHTIGFDIPNNDARHFYYRNDNNAGQVSRANLMPTTAANDGNINDIDPDHPHSFWSIQTASPLPALRDNVMVDGYCVAGSQMNDQPFGGALNTVLKIEVTGAHAGAIINLDAAQMPAPVDSLNAVVVRGLSIHNSGSGQTAVKITGNGTEGRSWFYGNFIGVDPSGLLEMSSAGNVFQVEGTGRQMTIGSDGNGTLDEAEINLMSGSTGYNGVINLQSSTTLAQIRNNYFGIGKDGTKNIGGGDGTTIVATNGTGNQIIGNMMGHASKGLSLDGASGYTVTGNFIGTNVAEDTGLGFATDGGSCQSCTGLQFEGNVLANNANIGFAISETSNSVFLNNYFYTNGGTGFSVVDFNGNAARSENVLLSGNTIFDNNTGVQVGKDADLISIVGNSIFENAQLGIDLTPDWAANGPETNDGNDTDGGSNRTMNYPQLTFESLTGNTLNLRFTIDVNGAEAAALDGYRLEFFANNSEDPSGHGEGEVFIGSVDITNDVGNQLLSLTIPPGTGGPDYWIAATATEIEDNTLIGTDDNAAYGATSEFSNTIYAFVEEICDNGIDDDGDGLIDCDDDDCAPDVVATTTDEDCSGGGGSIDLTATGKNSPFTYIWGDMVETAHLTFENDGNDISGNGHNQNGGHGTITYSNDAIQGNTSASFNGATYLRYSVDGNFMETQFQRLALAMWIKPTALAGIQTLFDEGGGVNGIAMRLNGNTLEAAVRNGSSQFNAGTHTFPADGQWHHVAMVYDNGVLTSYLDGVAGTPVTASYVTVNNHSGNGGFGYYDNGSGFGGGTGNYFIGLMDDVRYYYQSTISDAYVADLARNDGDRTELVAGNYSVTVTSTTGCMATTSAYIQSGANYTDGGTVGVDQNGCGNFDPDKIDNITSPSGGSGGTPQYKWEESTDGGGTWSLISGASDIFYNPGTISQTTSYRRASRLAPCNDWLYSNVVTMTILNNYTDGGTITGEEENCGSMDPATITSVTAPSGGTGGSPSFKWERSTDNGSTWVLVSGVTTDTYNPGTISQTTLYRRGVRLAPCTDWVYSNTVEKTIIDNFSDPGAIMGEEENCGSYDPNIISSITPPTGGVGGTLVYQWERSDNSGLTWSIIAGAVAQAYDPGTITKTTMYRRGARRAPCTAFVYSNVVTKLIAINYTNAGAIAGDEAVCGPFDPAPITNLADASGGQDGFPEYQWERSNDGGTVWAEISGANGATYDPGNIGTTTIYRRKARRLPCSVWVNSNMVTKTVKTVPFAFISDAPSGANDFLCENTSYTFEAQDAGDGSTFAWDFGAYATPASANGPGPHVVSYDVPDAAASTTVTVDLTVTLNGCVQTDTRNLKIRPEIVITNVATTDLTNCTIVDGEIAITATYPAGTSVEASVDGGSNWQSSLTFTGLSAGTHDVRVRYDNADCETAYGLVSLSEPVIGDAEMVLSNTEECVGETFTFQAFITLGSPTLSWDFGAGATPATASGKGPHFVSYSNGGAKSVTMSVEESGCTVAKSEAITVVENYTDGGTIIGDEGLCSTSDPSEIIAGASPIGGLGGTPEYQWEYREGDGAGNWTYWQAIAGATAATYDPSNITTITQYRRKARLSPCYAWNNSNEVTKIFSTAPVAFDDVYDSACPGYWFVDNVSSNDENLQNTNYTVIVQPPNGVVDIDADGEFVYTPNSTFCGSDQFTYQVCNDGSNCCDTATVIVDLSDYEIPNLQGIPADITISCDDEMPLPPLVEALENCQSVSLGLDEASTQGADSCAINSYVLTRIWTAVDYCGNYVSDEQDVTIVDQTNPDIFRIYEMPNGTRIVAGVMENVTDLWKTIRMPIQFDVPPVVLTQVVTQSDNSAVVTRLRNVATTQFQLRLQEEEANDGSHPAESVAWIAIEKGVSAGSPTIEAFDLLVSSVTTTLDFNTNFLETPGLFTSMMTFNENNPAGIRCNNLNAGNVQLSLEEEASEDPEVNHGYETVGYVAVDGLGSIENADGEVFGETGTITVTHNTINIPLENTYHNPVVVVGTLTNEDDSPATIRVKNVTATSFDIYIEEWDYLNGTHSPETVSYMVVEGSIPLDATVDCHDLPEALQINSELIAVDNCDNTVVISFEESDNLFDCDGNAEFTRTWSTIDECGNFTSLTQTFSLLDTIPPTFTVPGRVIMYCTNDKDDLTVTGDVYNEEDNCATGLEAVYTDNLDNLDGCGGFITRTWTLTDLCGNTTEQDQIITVINGNDTDNDGVPDDIDLDDDNDGIPDVIETNNDTDGDGITNDKDHDSDNDGIPDIIEAGFIDHDGDGVVDVVYQTEWDTDFDGIATGYDSNDLDTSLIGSTAFDTTFLDPDGDGIWNFWDLDSDNDGIPDCIEMGGVDNNGDGIIDYPVEGIPTSMDDEDSDGFSSVYDPDEDGLFGIDDPTEALVSYDGQNYTSGNSNESPDFDGDGIPNYLDVDSDNDGIPDLIEMGGVDENGDGKLDIGTEYVDANLNGFHDDFETDPLIITEDDGATPDGRPEDTDFNGSAYIKGDFDLDNSPQYIDIDSDGDGINDIAEMRNQGYDVNGDGKIDAITDANLDGFHDDFAASGIIFTDGDGGTNDGRPEDDNDNGTSPFGSNTPDGTFGENNGEPDIDDDGDGILNSLDLDSDGDLIKDGFEDINSNGQTDAGETDALDHDSDDDKLPDGVEDADLNGFYDAGETNPLDDDTDGDLFKDGDEDTNYNGSLDIGESDPRNACDPVLSTNCIGVKIRVKAMLQGAMVGNTDTLMRDDLREKGLIPGYEPYNDLDRYQHASEGGGEYAESSTFEVEGENAVVDWVMLELRHGVKSDSIVATRSLLLQADGDLVTPNGDSILNFRLLRSGNYYVALRHRNHLGVMTESSHLLSQDPILIDFTDENMAVRGNFSRVEMNGKMALWSGDFNNNREVIYQGPFNDILSLFTYIILNDGNPDVLANYIAEGYDLTDFNMDGLSIYQGPNNDRSKMLFNATLSSEENTGNYANFVLGDRLPETNSPSIAPSCQDDNTIGSCDYDMDGTINDLDLDDDNDGVKDINDVDPFNPYSDSDADGIKDIVETGFDGRYNPREDTHPLEQDTDGDGLKDGEEDANQNGILDAGETDPRDACEPVAFSPLCDFDNDGIINAFDLDDDNDGVPDIHDVNAFDPNSDSDGDGISDLDETGGDGIINIGVDSDPLNGCDPLTDNSACTVIDEDQDGFYSNYPPDHAQFDPNDDNPCIPQSVGSICPCEDTDGDGRIKVCVYWWGTPKTRNISLWWWPFFQNYGATCGPCQE